MSTVCKIQVAGFLLQCFLCHGNKHQICPFLFMRCSAKSELCTLPQFFFLCLFDAQASDKKLDMAVAVMHSFVVRI